VPQTSQGRSAGGGAGGITMQLEFQDHYES